MTRIDLANGMQVGATPCAPTRGHRDRALVAALAVVIPATFTMHKWGSADG